MTRRHINIQQLLEDYVQTENQEFFSVSVLLGYSAWDPNFDIVRLLELYLSREDKDSRLLADLIAFIPEGSLSVQEILQNAFLLACSKGNQGATLLLSYEIVDKDFLIKAMLRPKCRRYEDIVEHFYREGFFDLASDSTVQLNLGERQWLELFRRRRLESHADANPVKVDNGQQKFLDSCQTSSPMHCFRLWSNVDEDLHLETLELAVKSANYWATWIILKDNERSERNMELQHFFTDYLQKETNMPITVLILKYADYYPDFNLQTLTERYISKEGGDMRILKSLTYVLKDPNGETFDHQKFLSNAVILACSKGNQYAAFIMSYHVKIKDLLLLKGYLKAIYGRHEDIVEFFLRIGLQGPDDLAALLNPHWFTRILGALDYRKLPLILQEDSTFTFTTDDQQWMEELISRRGLKLPMNGKRFNPYAAYAEEKKARCRCASIPPNAIIWSSVVALKASLWLPGPARNIYYP